MVLKLGLIISQGLKFKTYEYDASPNISICFDWDVFTIMGNISISVGIYHYDVSQNTHHVRNQYGYTFDESSHIPASTNIFSSKIKIKRVRSIEIKIN